MPCRLKLDDAKIAKICAPISKGAYFKPAVECVGVTDRTGYNWLARGKRAYDAIEAGETITEDDATCLRFLHAVKNAENESEILKVIAIGDIGMGGVVTKRVTYPDGRIEETRTLPQWQALAWLLERKYPQRFGRIERHEEINNDAHVSFDIDPDEMHAIAAACQANKMITVEPVVSND